MALLFDFKCEDGHVNERLVKSGVTHTPCLDCNKMAEKIISPVRSALDPISGDFLGATEKLAKNRQQKILQERKANS